MNDGFTTMNDGFIQGVPGPDGVKGRDGVTAREVTEDRWMKRGLGSGYFDPLARHPQSQRFHELLKAAGDMHDRKQSDYGRTEKPFANIEASEEWGVPPWVGSMIRLNDKVRRLQKPAQGGTLANEGILDSLMDIAVYALIAYVMVEESEALDKPKIVA